MKKIITLLTLASFSILVAFILQFNTFDSNSEDVVLAVNASPIEVLLEHQTNEGNILLYRTLGGDELTLAFLSRNFTGIQYVESATQYDISALEEQAGITYVVLPKSDDIPFTIYAGLTTNPDLNEIFVTEPGFQIGHGVRMMDTRIDEEGLYVWVAASSDFSGENFSILGVSADGSLIGDIEHDGTTLTIHTIDTTQAY